MFVFTVFIIISAIAAPGAAAFGSMKSVFSFAVVGACLVFKVFTHDLIKLLFSSSIIHIENHNEDPAADCALFCVILTVNNHCESAFSSSIIHHENASPG